MLIRQETNDMQQEITSYRGYTISKKSPGTRTRKGHLIIEHPTEDLSGVRGSYTIETARKKIDQMIDGTLVRVFKVPEEAAQWAANHGGTVQSGMNAFLVAPPKAQTERGILQRPKNTTIHAKLKELLRALDSHSPFRCICSILDLTRLERLRDEQAAVCPMRNEDQTAVESLYERMIGLKRRRRSRRA